MFLRIVKERKTVAALLGEYTSDSDSDPEEEKEKGGNFQVGTHPTKDHVPQDRILQIKDVDETGINITKDIQKDATEPETYCPFFPTSQQDSNCSENVIREKLELLNEKFKLLEGRPNANQELVAQEKIRFETRLSDWKEGGINDDFFIKKLEIHERVLNLRFSDKIESGNTVRDRTESDEVDLSPPKKKCSIVIESKPIIYKKDDMDSFDPLSFVHPDRREYVLFDTAKTSKNILQKKGESVKDASQAAVICGSYSSHTDRLIDKWTNLRKEEERIEAEKNSLEGIERERTKEIQEWLSTQINTSASNTNPNFIPLGEKR